MGVTVPEVLPTGRRGHRVESGWTDNRVGFKTYEEERRQGDGRTGEVPVTPRSRFRTDRKTPPPGVSKFPSLYPRVFSLLR